MPPVVSRVLLLPLAAAVALAWISCGSADSTGDESADALIAWVCENAAVVESTDPAAGPEDLEFLHDVVGEARLVCLGESRHDVSEFFRLKHRIFRFLVEEMGFTVFLLEAGMPYCRSINRYIQGGEGDAGELLDGMGYWALWDTEEMLALIEWMRDYNIERARADGIGKSHSSRLRFYGIDVVYPREGIEEALDYVEAVDPAYGGQLAERSFGLAVFDDLSWIETTNRLRELDETQRIELANNLALLSKHLEDNRDEFTRLSGREDYLWAQRNVQNAERALEVFGALLAGDFGRGGELRDLGMAGNVIWLHQNMFEGERAALWAHNGHITRVDFEMPDLLDHPVTGMGSHLATRYDGDVVTLALLFGGGTYPADGGRDARVFEPNGPDYLDGVLHRTGIGMFAVDLRPAPTTGPAARWLDRPARLRAQDGDMVLTTRGAWDGVLFVDKVTPTRLNRRALSRLKADRPNG